MSPLDEYFTAAELVKKLREKTGRGTERTLRDWRARGSGPPWAEVNRTIIYPKAGVAEWLKARTWQSVSSRHRKRAGVAA